jgi:carbamoylphosphate synthase large subunit
VLVADPFRWHVCRPSRDVDRSFRVTAPNDSLSAYLDDLLTIISDEGVDLVLPVSEEALHVAQLAERLPPGVRLWAAPRSQLAQYHDKLDFAHLARTRGLAVPDTFLASSPEALELAAQCDFVVKPRHSCSGIGLHLARAGDPVEADAPGALVQTRIEGDHLSSLSFVHEGREVATVVYRGRVFAGTVAICFERVDDAGAVTSWIRSFIEDSSYSGFLAFDFIVDEDGTARAIECNPRVTSGVHFFDSRSLGEALLDPAAAVGIALSEHERYQWGYSTLTETYAALFRPHEFLRRWREMRRARDVIWSLRDPLPFLLMTPMSWEILWPAMTSDLTLGEATQRDIAWFGGAP